MKSKNSEIIKITSLLLLQFVFFLSVQPFSNSLILLKSGSNCGDHYIEVCKEHNDDHFVMSHYSEENDSEMLVPQEKSSPHDSSHKIKKINTDISLVKYITPDNFQIATQSIQSNPFLLPIKYKRIANYYLTSPPNIDLVTLRTIRIQI